MYNNIALLTIGAGLYRRSLELPLYDKLWAPCRATPHYILTADENGEAFPTEIFPEIMGQGERVRISIPKNN